MVALKKYDLSGRAVGEVAIDDALLQETLNGQLIKDYLVALRANARQWSAHTKTRAEVSHSGQKPHPQKGTGRARQGYLGAPHYKGGGRVFAPRAKFDQHVRINKKEKRAAIRQLLAEKIRSNSLHILQTPSLEAPKTKRVVEFLRQCNLEGKRVLVLSERREAGENIYDVFFKSMRNVPRIEMGCLSYASGYDLACAQDLVVMENAVDELLCMLGGEALKR